MMINDVVNNLPKVSVIVPAYNAEKNIATLIESLLDSDYPKELLEIIIVDNNSNDKTKDIVKQYPVILLEEKNIQSSYAARNRGIRKSNGEIIAFIDSDCIATPQWIKEGVKTLVSENADLVGGKVEFVYSKHKTAAELYDSITHMQNEFGIKEFKASTTANLFVKSFLFNEIGMFPDRVKSGGDGIWTSRATKNGFLLVYSPDAIVYHPARPIKSLLMKNYRIGTGMLNLMANNGSSLVRIICSIPASFLPPRLSTIKKRIHQRGTTEMNEKTIKIWCVSCLCKLSFGVGVLRSIFSFVAEKLNIKSSLENLAHISK